MLSSIAKLTNLLNKNRKFVRLKHKDTHWSVVRKKNKPIDKALSHFDDFYSKVFDKKWPSMRQALLSKPKYVAVVNNYSDCEQIVAQLENQGALNVRTLFELEKRYMKERREKADREKRLSDIRKLDEELDENVAEVREEPETRKEFSLEASLSKAQPDVTRLVDTRNALASDVLHQYVPATKIKGKDDWIPESDHYKYYDTSSKFNVTTEKEYQLHFPEHLNVYTFEVNNNRDFPAPIIGTTGVYSYYLLDGGSLLPVLALDLRPGHTFLDMCAAPGGKSLMAIQTLYPERVVCNDISGSRTDRLFRVFKQYLYDLNERWLTPGRLTITTLDARRINEEDYDRILVDVPCTTDRHSLTENDNNVFKPSRIKERLQLPELQCELLAHALRLVKPGGVVVYSTCSLSPVQNDGVVQMALKKIWEETNVEVVVMDLSEALTQAQGVYRFAEKGVLRYGHLVVPYPPKNFGPMYFCKLKRVK